MAADQPAAEASISITQPVELRDILAEDSKKLNENAVIGTKALQPGSIDQISRGWLSGWAWNPEFPDTSVTVEIVIDGKKMVADAQEFRRDLKNLGIGTGLYGFNIELPRQGLKWKEFSARVIETEDLLPLSASVSMDYFCFRDRSTLARKIKNVSPGQLRNVVRKEFYSHVADFVKSCYQEDFTSRIIESPQNALIDRLIKACLSQNIVNLTWIDEYFDHEFYFYSQGHNLHSQAHNRIINFSNIDCVIHFIEYGISNISQCSAETPICIEFYRNYYSDLNVLSDIEAYRHWLNYGINEGRLCSPQELYAQLGWKGLNPFISFDWRDYIALNPDLQASIKFPWQAFEHLLRHGVLENRQTGLSGSAGARFFFRLGQAHAVKGSRKSVVKFYERSLALDPSYGPAYELAGNAYLEDSYVGAALVCYQNAVEKVGDSYWALLNKARCLNLLGAYEEALHTLHDLRKIHPDWHAAKKLENDILNDRFSSVLNMANELAVEGKNYIAIKRISDFLLQCQEFILKKYCSLRIETEFTRGPLTEKIVIAALVNDNIGQCTHYRVFQKDEQVHKLDIEYKIFAQHQINEFQNTLISADIALFYRVPATPTIIDLILYASALNVQTIYEIDDLIFDSSVYPDSFDTYGGLITHKEYAGLVTGGPLFYHAMALCDYGLASTPTLASEMQKVVKSGQCFVHRNALSSINFRVPSKSYPQNPDVNQIVRLFYGSGTKAHNADFEELLAPALVNILGKYPQCRLVLVGHLQLPATFAPLMGQVDRFELIDNLLGYWTVLRTADINLAVLIPGPLTDAKSEIKWLEAAVLGIPSVVSNTRTHVELIEDGETGLIAATPADWEEQLDRLIRDPALRRQIGERARSEALSAYSREAMGENLRNIAENVIGGDTKARQARQPATTDRLKLMVVNVFFPPQAIGGATRVVRDNVDILIDDYEDLIDLHIVTTLDGCPEPYRIDRYGYRGRPVTRISTPQEPGMDWRWENAEIGQFFAELLERVKPDIVHFHCIQRLTASVARATREAGIPYVVTVHDGWWISDYQFLSDDTGRLFIPRAADPLAGLNRESDDFSASLTRLASLQEVLSGSDAVLAVSESFANIYREAGIRKVVAVPNGLPRPPEIARERSPSGRVRLLHLGGLARHKGIHLVKSALAAGSFKNLELTAVDLAADSGSEWAETWGTTPVRMLGKVPQDKIWEVYGQADVLLAPSTWPESYGLVAREALVCGLWVIASDLGAMGEDIREGENGFCVDVSSPRGIFAMLTVIDSDPERFLAPPPLKPDIRAVDEQVNGILAVYQKVITERGLQGHRQVVDGGIVAGFSGSV
jgi:glycosyltransferase involved in cell wall biosynthesis/tetratricopeptide (TPR) repeat protein